MDDVRPAVNHDETMRKNAAIDAAKGGGKTGNGETSARPRVRAPASASERRYRALIEASTSVVWRAEPSGAIVEAWGWDEFADQSKDSYLGAGWLEAVHPEDRERAASAWEQAVRVGELEPVEYRVRQVDGTYRWAHARAVALRAEDGAVSEWVGTVTDVQERKHSEQALREREELLRLAVEATGLGIWDMELPSRNTAWSPKLKAMAGLGTHATIDDDVFYNLVHPQDRDDVEKMITLAVESSDLRPYNIVYRL